MENFKNKIDKKLLKIQLEIERLSIRKLFRDGKIDWMNFGKESE